MVSNEGLGVLTGHPFPPGEASSGWTELNCWPRGSSGNLQTTQDVAKAKDCSWKTDSGASLAKTAPYNSLDMETLKVVPTRILHTMAQSV